MTADVDELARLELFSGVAQTQRTSSNVAGPLARLDSALFALESKIVSAFLGVIATVVFFDVIDRRLTAPDSRIADLGARLFGYSETPASFAQWGGYLGLLVGGLFLLGAMRRATHDKPWSLTWVRFAVAALVLSLLGVAFKYHLIPAGWLFIGLYALIAGATLYQAKLKETLDWKTLLAAVVGAALVVYVALGLPDGYSWSKEFALILLLWVGFLGASVCAYKAKHLKIEALSRAVPPKLKGVFAGLGFLVGGAFCFLMVWLSYQYLTDPYGPIATDARFPQTQLPDWLATLALPVAFGFTGLRFVVAALSSFFGGDYGQVDMEVVRAPEDDKETQEQTAKKGSSVSKKPIAFYVILVAIVVLPFFGKGGLLASILLACALCGTPLFALIGVLTVGCFWFFTDGESLSPLVERARELADKQPLLAIPLFIMSGTIMSRGQMSSKLINFANSLVGWLPGGLAISAVVACMLFASISGSSPATVIAIGAIMGPSLIKSGYGEHFSHGLLTSSGSLGILIPPSIPMIVYPIVNQSAHIEVEHLFASGFGPGLLIGLLLAVYCVVVGVRNKAKTQAFSFSSLWSAMTDGAWALLFPVVILGGIYAGIFNAVESSAISVVYALVVEVFIYRSIKLASAPKIFQETGIFLGSLLVIMIAALAFNEFLEQTGVPEEIGVWLEAQNLEPWQFILILNALLLLVGMAMDILSAMFVFVPLLAPLAAAMGIDPIHFGIIFIVNLEIGYLTPPVGLNLFVASTLFDRPIGHLVKSVAPFVVTLMVGLLLVSFVPSVSVGLGEWIVGKETSTVSETEDPLMKDEDGSGEAEPDAAPEKEEVLSLEEMMKEAEVE